MYKILANLSFKSNLVHYLPSCHSTNELAQDLLKHGTDEGTVVITDNQFDGKGQLGNSWLSQEGKNLTLSIVLKPFFLDPKEQFLITVAVSLAIKETLEEHLPGEAKIKWPNDIYFKNKKIGGLLIENTLRGTAFESCVVGIGLNINQKEFPSTINATSMVNEVNQEYNLNTIFNELLQYLDQYYLQLRKGNGSVLIENYHNSLLGIRTERKYRVGDKEFIGIIQGTDEYGRLKIRCNNELLIYQFKEVEMLF